MIGWYVHHVGGGHAARATRIAQEVRGPVTGLSSAPRPAGWPGDWVVLPRDDEPADDTSAPGADARAGGALHFAPLRPGFRQRQAAVAAWVKRARPTAMVVDVSVEITTLARLLGVPVVVMAMPGDRRDPPHQLGYDLAAQIIAPWPQGAHPEPVGLQGRVTYVGGISRFEGCTVDATVRAEQTGLVLWGTGGDNPGPDYWQALKTATPQWEWTMATDLPPETLWWHLQRSSVVIGHAGQGAVADIATAAAPAVIVAQPRPHDEQLATVRALDRLGLMPTAERLPEPHHWPELVSAALRSDTGGWKNWLGGGAATAARRIEEVAA